MSWSMPRQRSSARKSVIRAWTSVALRRGPRAGRARRVPMLESAATCRPAVASAPAAAPERRPAPGRSGGGSRAARCRPPPLPLRHPWSVVRFIVAFIGVPSARTPTSARAWPTRTPLDTIAFNQESTIYDRTGTVVLATFGEPERRQVGPVRPDLRRSSSTPPPPSRTRRSGRTPASTRWASSPRGQGLPPGQPPRRLHDHPAAGPQHACSTPRWCRTRAGPSSARSRRSSSRSA